MKVKLTTLYEESAQPEFHTEPDGAMSMNINHYSFRLEYSDAYAYVHLYKVNGDYILHLFAKVGRVVAIDNKSITTLDSDFANIRAAIAEFDSLLEQYKQDWMKPYDDPPQYDF